MKIFARSVSDSKRRMIIAYNEKCFFVDNGPVLSSLKDLKKALITMTDAQYAHHVNGRKNDFANWIEQVLLDKTCGAAVRKADTRRKTLIAVERALEAYA